jgi:hypothetical protein
LPQIAQISLINTDQETQIVIGKIICEKICVNQ